VQNTLYKCTIVFSAFIRVMIACY